jgi:hypothetical protein
VPPYYDSIPRNHGGRTMQGNTSTSLCHPSMFLCMFLSLRLPLTLYSVGSPSLWRLWKELQIHARCYCEHTPKNARLTHDLCSVVHVWLNNVICASTRGVRIQRNSGVPAQPWRLPRPVLAAAKASLGGCQAALAAAKASLAKTSPALAVAKTSLGGCQG